MFGDAAIIGLCRCSDTRNTFTELRHSDIPVTDVLTRDEADPCTNPDLRVTQHNPAVCKVCPRWGGGS